MIAGVGEALLPVLTPASTNSGSTGHAVAGWANCDAPDSEPSDQPASDPRTKKPARWPLLSAHRRGFTDRGSGRSRTVDGGFAIRTHAAETSTKTGHSSSVYTRTYRVILPLRTPTAPSPSMAAPSPALPQPPRAPAYHGEALGAPQSTIDALTPERRRQAAGRASAGGSGGGAIRAD